MEIPSPACGGRVRVGGDLNHEPQGWKMTTLGELAEITSSKRIFASEYLTSGIPFYRGKEIIEKFNGNEITTDLYISEETFDRIKSKFDVPSDGEILLTSVGTLGIPYVVKKDEKFYFKDGNITWIKKFSGIHNFFLYYWLISDLGKEQLARHTIGSTQQALTIMGLKSIAIFIPPLPEQRAIAAILSFLDDKIELLREQNKILEAIAQAIFKEWFVNFKFPEATGKMIDSELGKIPEGWRVGTYEDISNVVTGKGIKKENLKNNGAYQVLGANGEIGKTDEYLFNESLIVTGRVGTLGTVYISKGKVWISDNVLISKPKQTQNFYFSYFHLKGLNFTSLNRGSTQPLITQTDLKNTILILPNGTTVEKFHFIASNLFEKINLNLCQIQTLSSLRDALLPKLMKGEIRVKL